LLMTLAVEDDHHQVVDVAAEALRDRLQVGLHRGVDVDHLACRRTDDDLVHVAVGSVQEPALLRRREHGDGAGRPGGAEVGAFERIDCDVDLEVVVSPPPDVLPDEQHRRLVALAFPDHHRAPHGQRVHGLPHRLDGHVVGVLALPLTHRPGRLDRAQLAHPQEVARQRFQAHWTTPRWMSMTPRRNSSPSVFLRWNELRPMIEPKPPPSRMARISSMMAAVSLASPPEKMTMRRPANALWTTCRTRSVSVPTGIFSFS